MIFKNEGGSNIKRLTETTPIVHDFEQPYDYRKELTDGIKAGMQNSLLRAESSVNPQDYARLASFMRALNIPTPSSSDVMTEMRIRDFASSVLIRWQRDAEKLDQAGLLLVVQFDKSILMKTPHYLELISQLKAQAEANTLTPTGIAALRFLDPSFQPPARRTDVGIPRLHNFQSDRKELMRILRSLVAARLSGQMPRIRLDRDDWRVINTLLAEYRTHKAYRKIAMLAYYIRVITAEEIHFDHSGLHITDPAPQMTHPASAPKERPLQRNL